MAKKIQKAIQQLLFENDCVIIPGLGAFVSNHRSAIIDPKSGTLLPPSKEILFNQSVLLNDGLLANFISHEGGIKYEKAVSKIKSFCKESQKKLKQGAMIQFPGIGNLMHNAEGKITFNPSGENLRADSFGLPKLKKFPILRLEKKEEIIKEKIESALPNQSIVSKQSQIANKKPSEKTNPIKTNKPMLSSKFLVPAALLLLLMLFAFPAWMAWSLSKGKLAVSEPIEKIESEVSTFSSPAKTIGSSLTGNKPEMVDTSAAKDLETDSTSVEDGQIDAEEKMAEIQKQIDLEKEKVAAKPIEEEVEEKKPLNNQAGEVAVIMGLFGNKGNVLRLVEKLENAGYQSQVIDQSSGLQRVTVLFETLEDAQSELSALKEYTSGAFIKK